MTQKLKLSKAYQAKIDDVFEFDISYFTVEQIRELKGLLSDFLSNNGETKNLKPAGDMLEEEFKDAIAYFLELQPSNTFVVTKTGRSASHKYVVLTEDEDLNEDALERIGEICCEYDGSGACYGYDINYEKTKNAETSREVYRSPSLRIYELKVEISKS